MATRVRQEERFVQGAALAQARRILMERSLIRMDDQERDAFLALLESDPEPTKNARGAASQYLAWKQGRE